MDIVKGNKYIYLYQPNKNGYSMPVECKVLSIGNRRDNEIYVELYLRYGQKRKTSISPNYLRPLLDNDPKKNE